MSKADDYRAHARHIRTLALDVMSSDRARAFEELAQHWDRLADEAEAGGEAKTPPPEDPQGA